jgi:hypothetical protein
VSSPAPECANQRASCSSNHASSACTIGPIFVKQLRKICFRLCLEPEAVPQWSMKAMASSWASTTTDFGSRSAVCLAAGAGLRGCWDNTGCVPEGTYVTILEIQQ